MFLVVFLLNTTVFSQTNKYLLSKIAYEKADYSKSLKHISTYMSGLSDDSKAILLKVDILFKLGIYKDIEENILRLTKHKNRDYYLLLSRTWAGLDNQKKSTEYLNLYMKTRYKKSEAVIKSYKEFDILIKNEEWVSLWQKDWYSKWEKMINNAEYAISIKSYSEAETILDELLLKYSRSYKAFYMRAIVWNEKKNYKKALKNFESALNLKKDDNIVNLAYSACLIELKKTKKALPILNKIIETDSTEIDAFYYRAKLSLLTNNLENAQEDIDFCLKYYPDSENINYLAAQIDFKAGDFLSAIPKYGKLIKTNPAKKEYFIGRANCYMKTETYRYAINDYSMALDLNPKLPEIYYQKANAHLKLGEKKQACTNWNYSYKLGNNQCTKLIYKYCK